MEQKQIKTNLKIELSEDLTISDCSTFHAVKRPN